MDITLMYTPDEKKAFEEEQEARFFWVRYAKQLKAYTIREAAMDPKKFEALFHSEDEKKAP